MADVASGGTENRVRTGVRDRPLVVWHVAAFVVVNAFLWGLDIAGGSGVQWAYWVTIVWSLGLALHVTSYFTGAADGIERRLGRQYRKDERRYDEMGTQPPMGLGTRPPEGMV